MKDYFVGLDVGTDSVGWAVSDEEYNIPKFRGNAMWGVRLMDGGNTADEYRAFRSARRRTQRNTFRLQCMEMLFSEEIAKKDPAFFQRLKDSAYYPEDKREHCKYSLFNDENYTDRDYYAAYPTVYHLRKELAQSSAEHDVRLVYLALCHIIKNRGHFLFDSDAIGAGGQNEFSDVWDELNTYVCDNSYSDGFYTDALENVESLLKNRALTTTRKKEALIKEFSLKKKENAFEIAVVTLLSGGTAKAKDLFDTAQYDDTDAKSISFASGYDEKADVYASAFEERFELIEKIKAVYDWSVLADILNGEKYISFAKVNIYNKHKSDLALLKEYVRAYAVQKYNLIFKDNSDKLSNYLAYSGFSKKAPVEKKCSQQEFCDFLKKELPKEPAEDKYAQMYDEIAAASFMPKAVTKDNSVIPMQINREELKAILGNAQTYLPFLSEADESGKTVSEKIIDIFSFRIPYYVGPLNTHSDKSWLVRTGEKIYPWNFNEVVDTDKSAQNFIENLTSKCTYLPNEDVIPKNSLLYCAFMTLNELNNLKLDGEPITVELKQSIYTDLFEKKNKVKMSDLKKYLAAQGIKDAEITGVDGDFKSSLKPFRDLELISLPYSDKEEIIKAVTIFGDDKRLLKNRLKNNYGDVLSDSEISKIAKLKYTGWSKLSAKLLTGIEAVIPDTGEYTDIIHAMWDTNNNLMQLLSSAYDFTEKIDEENKSIQFTTLRDEVDSLYISPKIKRPVYQAMQIVREIEKIQGCPPKKIFVEVARSEGVKGDKGRKASRKQKLIDLYKSCKQQETELYEQLLSRDESEFRRDALYLYFTQFGKCMYTGKPIDIGALYDKNVYNIDHIYPRSKIKDDSLDNRVLVMKKINEIKDNNYPVSAEIRSNMTPFWKMLLSKELISKKKFDRLTRSTPLTDDELASFISRQLVETSQSTKAIAQLLKKRYPDTDVEYIKANLVSEFRHNNDMLKCRDVNDFHHAKDAYLNIVVGNVYTVKARLGKWSANAMFEYTTKGAWIAENNESMNIVKANMAKSNIRFTRFSFKQGGGLFDQNPLKKGKGQVPRKKGMDIEKYGGYNRPGSAYFAFAEYKDKKGNTVRSFEPVDLYIENEYLENPQEFISKRVGSDDVKILIPCVKYNALISIDGFRMHISSKSGGGATIICKPAVQLVVSPELEHYVKKLSSYLAKCTEQRQQLDITPRDEITSEKNEELYDVLAHKMTDTVYSVKFNRLGNALLSKQDVFASLTGYEQCNTLMQIINILHANVLRGDLTAVGEPKNSGIVTMSNKLQPGYKSAKLINQSITGLFENEIDLLK